MSAVTTHCLIGFVYKCTSADLPSTTPTLPFFLYSSATGAGVLVVNPAHAALQTPPPPAASPCCSAIGAEVLIDDNPAYAKECAEAGIHVLLYDWQVSSRLAGRPGRLSELPGGSYRWLTDHTYAWHGCSKAPDVAVPPARLPLPASACLHPQHGYPWSKTPDGPRHDRITRCVPLLCLALLALLLAPLL